jgi:hypothetical protein
MRNRRCRELQTSLKVCRKSKSINYWEANTLFVGPELVETVNRLRSPLPKNPQARFSKERAEGKILGSGAETGLRCNSA